ARRPLLGPGGPAPARPFSPAARFLLSAGADHSARLWERATGKEVRKFEGHTDWVWCVRFAADGKRAVSGGADTTIRIWEVDTGKEQRRCPGHTMTVTSVAFSPD